MDSRDSFLLSVMNRGFEKAATSFSRIIQASITVSADAALMRNHPSLSYGDASGDLYVLTTQIIGDVSGKSFLILSNKECQEIFRALNGKVANEKFQEAFLLEIDNIISASVISELANALNAEIYGDVPKLTRIAVRELSRLVETEMLNDGHSNLIYCNTSFLLNSVETKPHFIWKLSDEIFEMIQASKR
jgi:chemotaxis protein CheY-P-specific phosphatase CheC